MIKCGHCKERHTNVFEVRCCSTVKIVSTPAKAFILPCRNCGELVSESGRYSFDHVHTVSGERQCIPGDVRSGSALPVKHCKKCQVIGEEHSHCSKCDGLNVKFTQDAWANNWNCSDCGYHFRYSLGD